MPTATTVTLHFLQIIAKIVAVFFCTIYQLLVRLYNLKFGPHIISDDDSDSAVMSLVKKTKLTPNLCLREIGNSSVNVSDGSPKPFVIFFPRLLSSCKSVDRYSELYHAQGWDVLTIQGQIKHFLWPPKACAVARELMTYLRNNEAQQRRPLVIHATSVGAYMYTVFLMELQKRSRIFEKITSRIKGQVFDSIVLGGLDHMGSGIAKSCASTAFVQYFVTASVKVYLKMTRQYTIDFFNLAVSTFYNNPVKSSALFFSSCDDPMSEPKALEDIVYQWRSTQKEEVITKCWAASPHARHLQTHPEEYRDTLESFIAKIMC